MSGMTKTASTFGTAVERHWKYYLMGNGFFCGEKFSSNLKTGRCL
jgi:hypothetical protein